MAATTLDPAEIAKFSALAAEWWNPKGRSARCTGSTRCGSIYLATLALAPFRCFGALRRLEQASRSLDLGCGGGLVSAPLARMGAKLTGDRCLSRSHWRGPGLRRSSRP